MARFAACGRCSWAAGSHSRQYEMCVQGGCARIGGVVTKKLVILAGWEARQVAKDENMRIRQPQHVPHCNLSIPPCNLSISCIFSIVFESFF